MKKLIYLPILLIFLTFCAKENIRSSNENEGQTENEDVLKVTTKSLDDNPEKEIITFDNGIRIEKVDTTYVFQGDIVLSKEQVEILQTSSKQRGAIINFPNQYWPNNIVYYTFDSGFRFQTEVMKAIDDYHARTNVVFIPATESEPNKVKFIHDGNKSNSNLGMIGGIQTTSIGINLDTIKAIGTVIHELGHVTGLLHEHTKINRNDFINVNYDNMEAGIEHDFDIYPSQVYDSPFDFESIMLYGSYAGSKNYYPVMTKKDGTTWSAQDKKLSFGDINMINTFYQHKEGNVRALKIPTHGNNGAGACVADINNNGKPDIMFMAVDAPDGLNYVNYGILWDVNQSGQPTSAQNYYLRQSFTSQIGRWRLCT